MNLNNRNDLNRMYSDVHSRLEELIMKYKIKPLEMRDYVTSNMEDILEEFGLSNNEHNRRVVSDVANHIVHSVEDGIMTFESFIKFM